MFSLFSPVRDLKKNDVYGSSNAYCLYQFYSQMVISNLSRSLLAAARTRDADGVVAGRHPSGKIEFHTESDLRILEEKKARSHGD